MEIQTRNSEVLLPPPNKGGRPRNDENPDQLRVLSVTDERKHWRMLVAQADDPKLKLEVLKAISELRRGRPYVATNPRASKTPAADNRLLVAINNLNLGGSKHTSASLPAAAKPKRKKRQPAKKTTRT